MPMTDFNVLLAVMAGTVLVLGVLSREIRLGQGLVSEPMVALLIGIVFGPYVIGVIDLGGIRDGRLVLEQLARVTVALAVAGAALRLPADWLQRNWRDLALLIGVVMPLMWLASSVIVGFVLGASLWWALLLGAIVTPTDPVLASAILTTRRARRYVPERLRNLLSAESGVNDGLAFPLVMLPMLVLRGETPLVEHLVLVTLLWQVVAATLYGLGVGLAVAWALRYARSSNWTSEASTVTIGFGLSLFILASSKLAGAEGIVAAFAAAAMLNRGVHVEVVRRQAAFREAVGRLFELPGFVFVGAALPFRDWADMGWPLLLACAAILLLRRLPAVALVSPVLRLMPGWRDVAFTGWFGPIGIAALYYALLAERELHDPRPFAVATAVIAASVVAHGISSTQVSRLYRRWYDTDEEAEEA